MGVERGQPREMPWEADADVTRPLMNHSFLHARLKQPRRLLGHDGITEIGALPLAASVALKEVELRSRLHSYCNDSLFQTLPDTDHGADKG